MNALSDGITPQNDETNDEEWIMQHHPIQVVTRTATEMRPGETQCPASQVTLVRTCLICRHDILLKKTIEGAVKGGH